MLCVFDYLLLEIYYFGGKSSQTGRSLLFTTLIISSCQSEEPATADSLPHDHTPARAAGDPGKAWLPLHFLKQASLPCASVVPVKDLIAEVGLLNPNWHKSGQAGACVASFWPSVSAPPSPTPVPSHSLCTTAWKYPSAHTKAKLFSLSPCTSLQTHGFA